MEKIKIGLALGSGGLCGMTHLGFLQVLEENNIELSMISGSSMGSVIGGLYASGLSLKVMENEFLRLNKADITDLNYFQIVKSGLLAGKKFEDLIEEHCIAKEIENARIPYYSVAYDIKSGKRYIFDKGKFSVAIRASSSIPAIFAPVEYDNCVLIDGGILDIVPFHGLRERGADIVIAVNCLNDYTAIDKPKNVFEMLTSSLNLVQDDLWRYDKDKNKSKFDLYVRDNLEGIDPISLDLKQIPKLIAHGRKCALKVLPQIKKLIEEKKKEKANKSKKS